MIVHTDWSALAQRVAGQVAKANIEDRGATVDCLAGLSGPTHGVAGSISCAGRRPSAP
jgi:hypothetical protein